MRRTLTIETARLRLRPLEREDLNDLHRLWTDPDVRRYLWDDEIISRDRVAVEINSSLESFRVNGFGLWAIVHAADNSMIGFCGLRSSRESSDVELLFGLGPSYWDRGFALEAAKAVLGYGFKEKNLTRIVAAADAPNLKSFRVMERAGMTFQREERGQLRYYALTRQEFEKSL